MTYYCESCVSSPPQRNGSKEPESTQPVVHNILHTHLVVLLPLRPLPVAGARAARPLAVVAVPLGAVPVALPLPLAVVVAPSIVVVPLSGVAPRPAR